MDLAGGLIILGFLLSVGSLMVGCGLLVICWVYREHAIRGTLSLRGILVVLAGLAGFVLVVFGLGGLISLFG